MTPPLPPDVVVRPATSTADLEIVRELFTEYQQSLGVSLCFQGFEAELATLPGDYAPPAGALLLACHRDRPIGCVGLRPLAAHTPTAIASREAELKRLYLRPQARGLGIGRALANSAIDAARHACYDRIRLDTLDRMQAAQALYAQLGFVDGAAYCYNPLPGVRYMVLELNTEPAATSAKLPLG